MKCIKCGYDISDQDNKTMNNCPECKTDFLDTYAYIYLDHNNDLEIQNEALRRIYLNTCRWIRTLVKESLNAYERDTDLNQEVQDVVNDIYLKVIKNIRLYDPNKGGFRTWFNQIVRNHLCDRFRVWQNNKEDLADNPDFAEELPSIKIGNPEEHISNQEKQEMLHQMMACLNIEQRICIVLHDLEGWKNKEIADMLNVSENTVKTRIFNGRKKLEKRGMEMKAQGYKLYGLAPGSLFLWLYRDQEIEAAEKMDVSRINEFCLRNKNTKKIGDIIVGAEKSVFAKVMAGLLAVAIIGGTGIYYSGNKSLENSEENEEEMVLKVSDKNDTEESEYNIPQDILSGYRDVLIAYGQASSNVPVEHLENLGNEGYGMYLGISMPDENGIIDSVAKIQYALQDVNEDGYDELLITFIRDNFDSPITEGGWDDLQIWTNDGSQVYEVVSSAYRSHVTLREGGVIRESFSGGYKSYEYDYREFNNQGELTVLEILSTEKGEKLDGVSKYDGVYSEKIEWVPLLKL